MPYSIEEHKHRFAAWAASRAASVKGCRFSVAQGKRILEDAQFNKLASDIGNLPESEGFDRLHRKWRNDVIQAAQTHQINFSHGVAAKLINVYLKSIFVCSDLHEDPRIKAIHPPIDSLLLDSLYKNDIGGNREKWNVARKTRWSKLNSTQYESVISAIQDTIPSENGLWTIEEYWQGYQ